MPRVRSILLAVFGLGLLANTILPQATPIFVGESLDPMLAPATDRDGQVVAFCSAVNSDGTPENVWNAWVSISGTPRRLTNYPNTSSGVTSFTLSSDGSQLAYIWSQSGFAEEIHAIGIATGADACSLRIRADACNRRVPVASCPAHPALTSHRTAAFSMPLRAASHSMW
jgi:hypothetical protein